MVKPHGRRALPFAAGCAVATTALVGATAWANMTAPAGGTIRACVLPSGLMRLLDDSSHKARRCPNRGRIVEWNVVGPAGPAGPKGDTGPPGPQGEPGLSDLVSPNGQFKIEVTNRGIFLRGPGGTIYVDRFGADTTSSPIVG